jgi:hypothetical protein
MEIEFVKKMDFSKVDQDDRPGVRTILIGVLTFDEIMPELTSDINPTPEHYNITLKGWNMPIDIEKLYKTFLDESTRSSKYDSIKTIQLVPANNLLVFKVRRSNFHKMKKKNFK